MAKAKQQAIPKPALILGLAGLIPFIGAAIATALPDGGDTSILATRALGAYGAVILSFLGGVKWGVLLNDKVSLKIWTPMILSVVPSLIAWVALLLPAITMLSILAAAMVLQYFLDTKSVQQKKLPPWYGRLRIILTTGAVLSLLVGLIAQVLS